jgi:hypothetical protein
MAVHDEAGGGGGGGKRISHLRLCGLKIVLLIALECSRYKNIHFLRILYTRTFLINIPYISLFFQFPFSFYKNSGGGQSPCLSPSLLGASGDTETSCFRLQGRRSGHSSDIYKHFCYYTASHSLPRCSCTQTGPKAHPPTYTMGDKMVGAWI